jgi:hypothetical protein
LTITFSHQTSGRAVLAGSHFFFSSESHTLVENFTVALLSIRDNRLLKKIFIKKKKFINFFGKNLLGVEEGKF